ncbi:MAG: BMC domain-containing protein [Kofleriaceae bacterium]
MDDPAQAAARGPALGLVETSSIARGVVAIDAALKRSPAILVSSKAVSGGKHLACFEGGVAEVGEAMAAARAAAGALLLDDLELPLAAEPLWAMLRALGGEALPPSWSDDADAEAVALVETQTVCSALRAADAACKATDVAIRDTRLAFDLAGKALFTMTGALHAIEAAAAAAASAAEAGRPGAAGLVLLEVIAQPAPELRGRLFR